MEFLLRSTGLAALAFSATLGAPGPLASESANPTERNKRIVADAFDRWAAGGTTFFTDVLAPDVVWTIEGSGPSAGVHQSRDALIERAARPLAARLSEPVRPTMKRVWGDGDHVIVHWEGEGVARDRRLYRNRYAWILRMRDGKAVEVNAFLDLAAFDDVLRRIPEREQASPERSETQQATAMQAHPYVGMWVTGDGRIRHELLPNGRYDEARGARKSAYQGRYEVTGNRIAYWDDTGFAADGVFVGPDELHHGGMIFTRER